MSEPKANVSGTPVGNVGGGRPARVDPHGVVTPRPRGWSLDWWIEAEDRRHHPSREAGVRQRLVGLSPVVETLMRVPGGDAVHRAFAVQGDEELVVVEVENRSPVPFIAALSVIRPGWRRVRVDDRQVTVGWQVALLFPRRPTRVEGTVSLFPVPHTAVMRVAIPLAMPRRAALPPALPPAQAVVRGWDVHARRGMRLEAPSGRLAEAFEANRRFMLLLDQRLLPPRREAAGVLQDRLRCLLETASPTYTWPEAGAGVEFVSLVRDLLVRETADGGLALCSMLPDAWAGQPIEVHDAPTHAGLLSFAVRWHGDRPALLWELQPRQGPVRITCPALNPGWSTTDVRGEVLGAELVR